MQDFTAAQGQQPQSPDSIELHADERLAARAPDADGESCEPKGLGAASDSYTPFPVHVLPGPVRYFVVAAAAAIGCCPSFIALPLLACLARAIGNKRVIRLKGSWTEPAIIWAAIVGKSGTHKTPAMQAAMKFLNRLESKSFAGLGDAVERYQQEMACYERDMQAWKRRKANDEPAPREPEPPTCERFVTSDATIEALAVMLSEQFDGVLVSRDELAGWLNGIAEYKGGKGSDLGHWLAAWSATTLTVDRKTGVRTLHVPRAAVSLVGGIQPGVLRGAIGREHMVDGLCARLLLAMPTPKPVRWSEALVDPAAEAAMAALFDKLTLLEPVEDDQGNKQPAPLDLTPEAKALWVRYFNRHGAEAANLDDDLAAAWSKLKAYTARFALIFALCEWAAGDASVVSVGEVAMQAAIELSDWFGGEAKRVYGLFEESDADREVRELVELIQRKGGEVTPRDLAHGCRRFRAPGEAEAALEGLEKRGLGAWKVEQTAGRPARVFVIHTSDAGNGNGSPANPPNLNLVLPLPGSSLCPPTGEVCL